MDGWMDGCEQMDVNRWMDGWMDVNRWMDGWMDDGCECELLNNLNNQSKNDATKKRMMGYVCVCVFTYTCMRTCV